MSLFLMSQSAVVTFLLIMNSCLEGQHSLNISVELFGNASELILKEPLRFPFAGNFLASVQVYLGYQETKCV